MTSTVGASPGAREPLRHREFRWLLAARFTGFVGGAVAPVALAFAVLDLTGSVRDLGLVVGARSLANVLLLLVGGVLADRLPLAVLLRGSAVAAALTQAAVAALVLSGTANLTSLAALSALGGAVSALLLPGAGALTPRTVPASLLQPANALLRLTRSAAVVGGSALAGILVAAVGPGWGIAVDAASFAAAAVCFGRIRLVAARPGEESEAVDDAVAVGRRSLVSDLREGWSEFAARTWLWAVVLQSLVLNAVYAGAFGVLGPAVADASFGRRTWGLLLAASTVGMVLGGLLALRWRPRRALAWGTTLMGLLAPPLVLLGSRPDPALLAVTMVLLGVAVEQQGVAWDVAVQQHVPGDRLARVLSYDMLGSFVAIPLGQVAVGPVAAVAGVSRTLTGSAVLVVGVTALTLASRSVRSLRRDP